MAAKKRILVLSIIVILLMFLPSIYAQEATLLEEIDDAEETQTGEDTPYDDGGTWTGEQCDDGTVAEDCDALYENPENDRGVSCDSLDCLIGNPENDPWEEKQVTATVGYLVCTETDDGEVCEYIEVEPDSTWEYTDSYEDYDDEDEDEAEDSPYPMAGGGGAGVGGVEGIPADESFDSDVGIEWEEPAFDTIAEPEYAKEVPQDSVPDSGDSKSELAPGEEDDPETTEAVEEYSIVETVTTSFKSIITGFFSLFGGSQ